MLLLPPPRPEAAAVGALRFKLELLLLLLVGTLAAPQFEYRWCCRLCSDVLGDESRVLVTIELFDGVFIMYEDDAEAPAAAAWAAACAASCDCTACASCTVEIEVLSAKLDAFSWPLLFDADRLVPLVEGDWKVK